jgi:hypothetical protein
MTEDFIAPLIGAIATVVGVGVTIITIYCQRSIRGGQDYSKKNYTYR